jgi:ubiquinone/menaquinone biosynthesis C-methylase UbiE
VSLSSIEHFGLGRYGDSYDLDADKKAFSEMRRVLKPGGILVFTTTITRARPSICFNAHRIYSYGMIKEFCAGMVCVEEKNYSKRLSRFCSLDEVTNSPKEWDVYCGCWKK